MKYALYFKTYQILLENKEYYKMSIPGLIDYIERLKGNGHTWIWLDTETTGLNGPEEEQITQLAAIATNSNGEKISNFHKMVQLNNDTKMDLELLDDDSNKAKALDMNHYNDNADTEELEKENDVLSSFLTWLSKHKNPILVIQNADFDMDMIKGRSEWDHINYPILDLLKILQFYIVPLYTVLADQHPILKDKLEKSLGRGKYGFFSASQPKWAKLLGLNGKDHDARGDVETMIKLYDKYIEILNKYKDIDISQKQSYAIDKLEK